MKAQTARFVTFIAALIWTNLFAQTVCAQTENLEYQIKAAFLLKFASYVEWPAAAFTDNNSPLVIGVLGSQSMYDNLQEISQNQKVQDRAVQVLKLEQGQIPEALHVLFTTSALVNGRLPLPADATVMSTLIVTENIQLQADSEGMINFSIMDNRVNFDVALVPAQKAGLKLSSRLLQVAQKVIQ